MMYWFTTLQKEHILSWLIVEILGVVQTQGPTFKIEITYFYFLGQ